ncbi:hypothetical protein N8D74_10940 [Curtobacterium flaccumfaciens]|uniref:Uncharacterized protein n=1 Tax=Curtobacterium poinsettiae TaxID=159612 RepID=A0A9Q9T416_9MICO|nr:hypothetical protein [Curtobacterium flaccumfaciens]UXN24095.1 hypothetical protein N8D74_10940 [Curtobacterium flaccumfaciens]UYC82209.1 hypothetical protein OE229_07025 [Curtobacterium flaccumfaciens pv. poinsettiae]
MIVEHGRNEFDAARSLTYRAAEAEALWQDITRNRPDGQSVNALLLQHPELWMIVGKLIYTGPSEAKYQHLPILFSISPRSVCLRSPSRLS